jgi:hypothetical protein
MYALCSHLSAPTATHDAPRNYSHPRHPHARHGPHRHGVHVGKHHDLTALSGGRHVPHMSLRNHVHNVHSALTSVSHQQQRTRIRKGKRQVSRRPRMTELELHGGRRAAPTKRAHAHQPAVTAITQKRNTPHGNSVIFIVRGRQEAQGWT